ncbi:NAD(P)H-binding protein [Actinomycetaceae bacterium TAE3-ERU4]|nr:NAD(P)H-binding protein [Actinomycetaceae bacterium TAE3-ERU4]
MKIILTGAASAICREIAGTLDSFSVEREASPSLVSMSLMTRYPNLISPEVIKKHQVITGDYADKKAMEEVFIGNDILFLAPAERAPEREQLHRNAIEAAQSTGIRHIVYLSFMGAGREKPSSFGLSHLKTEQILAKSGVNYTILRSGFTLESLEIFRNNSRVFWGPIHSEGCAFIAQRDVSDCIVSVLVDVASGGGGGHNGRIYTLTGPRVLTIPEVLKKINDFLPSQMAFSFCPLSANEAIERFKSMGEKNIPGLYEQWKELFEAVEQGEFNLVTKDVQKLLGTPGREIDKWLESASLI